MGAAVRALDNPVMLPPSKQAVMRFILAGSLLAGLIRCERPAVDAVQHRRLELGRLVAGQLGLAGGGVDKALLGAEWVLKLSGVIAGKSRGQVLSPGPACTRTANVSLLTVALDCATVNR